MKDFTIKVQQNDKLRMFALAFLMFSFSSYGNANSNSNLTEKGNNSNTVKSVESVSGSMNTSGELEKAKKSGKTVFLVITAKKAIGLENLLKTAMDAKKIISKSEVIQLDRDDPTNTSLISKLGVATVSLPFILVISPKGVPVAGYPSSQATSALLVKAVPSPKADEVLFAISEKKPVFIVVSKKGLSDKSAVLINCKAASAKIASRPAIIEFDFNDSKESAFLKQIDITSLTNKTKTLVVNSSGQIADSFEGIVLESALTASVNKQVKSSCCPSGSSKSGCK